MTIYLTKGSYLNKLKNLACFLFFFFFSFFLFFSFFFLFFLELFGPRQPGGKKEKCIEEAILARLKWGSNKASSLSYLESLALRAFNARKRTMQLFCLGYESLVLGNS